MSEPAPAPASRRFALAVAASLVIHALAVAPFLLRLPDAPAAAKEDTVPVELVPPPEPPPAEEKPRQPEAAEKPAAPPPPQASPTKTPAAGKAEPPAGAPQPFEASAGAAPDEPPPDSKPVPPPQPATEAKPAELEEPPADRPDGAGPAPAPKPAASSPEAKPSTDVPKAPEASFPTTPSPAAVPPADAPSRAEQSSSAEAATPPPEPVQRGSEPPKPKPTEQAGPPSVLSVEADAQKPRQPAAPLLLPASPAESSAGDPEMSAAQIAAFVPARPVAPQVKPPSPSPGGTAGAPPLRKVETLYAKDILADPRVRGALSKLPPGRRMSQICSIEVLEQVRRAGFTPDMLASPADGGVEQGPTRLATSGGAVRSRGVWREIAYDCRVDAEATTITDLRFSLGAVVPRSQWAARKLNVD